MGALTAAACLACGGTSRPAFPAGRFVVQRCDTCGLGWVEPMPQRAELAALYAPSYYEGGAFGYPEGYANLEPGLKRTYRGLLRRVARAFPDKRFGRVLDVGCAFGYFLDVAREQCGARERVGLDATDAAAAQVRARGHEFTRGFVEDVALPDDHFDLVFLGDCFEHFADPDAAVARLRRALAPGGVLLLTTIDFGSRLARWKKADWRLLTPPEHLWFWTHRALRSFFAARGLPGRTSDYWLWYPKDYVRQRVHEQFGFGGSLLRLWPSRCVPVFSVDVVCGMFVRES